MARVGAAVAIALTPLQVINVFEFSELPGNHVTHLFVGLHPSEDPRPMQAALELFGDDVVVDHFVRDVMVPDMVNIRTAVERRDGLLRQLWPLLDDIDQLVIGHYQFWLVTEIAQWASEHGVDVVYVDDGTNTLGIDRVSQAARVGEVPARWEPRLPDKVEFFTVFADEIKAGPLDSVVANDYAAVRARLSSLPVDDQLAVMIGQPLAEAGGVSTEAARKLALELAATARSRWPAAEPVYVPHRFESAEKLAAVREESGARILEVGVPFEVLPLTLGAVPGKVIGWSSTVLVTAAKLFPPQVEIVAVKLAPSDLVDDADDHIVEKARELHDRIYRMFAAEYADRIAVI